MLNTTHRLSERNPDAHAQDVFCINCVLEDLDRDDFGKEIAVLLLIDFQQLAAARATVHGASHWIHEWGHHLLSHKLMQSDLISINANLRAAATQARKTLADYVVCWKTRREPDYKHASLIPVIEARTHERLAAIIETNGQLELFGHVVAG